MVLPIKQMIQKWLAFHEDNWERSQGRGRGAGVKKTVFH